MKGVEAGSKRLVAFVWKGLLDNSAKRQNKIFPIPLMADQTFRCYLLVLLLRRLLGTHHRVVLGNELLTLLLHFFEQLPLSESCLVGLACYFGGFLFLNLMFLGDTEPLNELEQYLMDLVATRLLVMLVLVQQELLQAVVVAASNKTGVDNPQLLRVDLLVLRAFGWIGFGPQLSEVPAEEVGHEHHTVAEIFGHQPTHRSDVVLHLISQQGVLSKLDCIDFAYLLVEFGVYFGIAEESLSVDEPLILWFDGVDASITVEFCDCGEQQFYLHLLAQDSPVEKFSNTLEGLLFLDIHGVDQEQLLNALDHRRFNGVALGCAIDC